MTTHNRGRVSPFGHPRINALLTTPRGITQPHTSFIGPACQGIHHAPLSNKHKHTPTPTTTKSRNQRSKRVPGYTNTYSQSQNTHTKPEQEQSSSPQLDEKYTSLQRRKMLASTIQFSHTTPSRHKHHHSDIRIYPGHKDNHPHTTQPTRVTPQCAGTMCCPRHPTAHQCFRQKPVDCSIMRHPHHESCVSPGGILTPRVHVHLEIFTKVRVCSTTHGYSTAQPHTQYR